MIAIDSQMMREKRKGPHMTSEIIHFTQVRELGETDGFDSGVWL